MEVLARGDQPLREHVVAQDALFAVDVVEEHLERLHALLDAALETRPLGSGDDPGNQIEREGPLLTGQRERHALVDERPAEGVGSGGEVGSVRGRERLEDALVGRADGAVAVEHLVERQPVAPESCSRRTRGRARAARPGGHPRPRLGSRCLRTRRVLPPDLRTGLSRLPTISSLIDDFGAGSVIPAAAQTPVQQHSRNLSARPARFEIGHRSLVISPVGAYVCAQSFLDRNQAEDDKGIYAWPTSSPR